MKLLSLDKITEIARRFSANQVGIIPTDTIYGLAAVATDITNKYKICDIKKRDRTKELTIIVSSIQQMASIINITPKIQEVLLKHEQSITILAPKLDNNYLAKIYKTNAKVGVRVTSMPWLQNLIKETGPIFCTSVNLASQPPLNNLEELKKFPADFLVDGKEISTGMSGNPTKIYDATTDCWIR